MTHGRTPKLERTKNPEMVINRPRPFVTLLYGGLLIFAGLVAYGNSFSGIFLFDDYGHIVTNERIRQLSPLSNLLTTTRPLVTLSLALNYWLDDPRVPSELNPTGFHVANLLIHLLAALTLFGLIRRTLKLPSLPSSCRQRADGLALSIALLWTVHPLTTQSVTYIIQRGESMMGLFYLLTIYCLNRHASSKQTLGWNIAAVTACACGMTSKAVMVTAPIMAVLYDRIFLSDSFGQALRRRWPLYLGLAATWLIPFLTGTAQGVLDGTPRDSVSVGFGYQAVSPWAYLSAQPGVLAHYVRLSLWPMGQCLDYNWQVPQSVRPVLLPAILIVILMLASLAATRRQSALAFPGIWFFLILAPTSSIIPIKDLAFEHRMYLPLAAVITTGVLFIHGLIARMNSRWISLGVLTVIAAALMLATYRRNRVYHSEIAMWTDVTTKRPGNARAYDSLGVSLSRAGRLNEALSAYRQAVRLDPESPRAHANLGKALAQKELYEQAIPYYEKAVALGSTGTNLRYSLALAHAAVGRTEDAIDGYRQVLSSKPDHPFAGLGLGVALDQANRPEEAADQLRTHLGFHFGDVAARLKLASVLVRLNKLDAAVTEYRTVLNSNPRHLRAHYDLGVALQGLGQHERAIEAYRSALAVEPNYEPARQALEAILRKEPPRR
ncbi:MAG: tetratricopeptide repeat protein [Phycisphaerales bacterium]|nr:tetratricopeptide repeat protein [Phycisphaerales bacterium]